MNTQEQKELLLKDLCARLPYGVKVKTTYISPKTKERHDVGIDVLSPVEISMLIDGYEEHKPYLFPLSSMTEEQKIELNRLGKEECDIIEYVVNNPNPKNIGFPVVTHYMVDWCNKNHFDYRGLIPMDLANDATGLNIY